MKYTAKTNFTQPQYHTRRILDRISFLNLFEAVSGGGRFSPQGIENFKARCPAHHDKNPSLSIGITKDGRYLVHCYAGCTAEEILHSVGLTLQDLYPDGAVHVAQPAIKQSFTNAILDEVGKRWLSEDEKKAALKAFEREQADPEWPK